MTAGDRAGVPEPDLTLIVDGANVVGSRPDGWWRDRAGAAIRLYDELAGLAERGAAGIPAAQLATGEDDEAPAGPTPPPLQAAGRAGTRQAGPGQAGTGQVTQQDGPTARRPWRWSWSWKAQPRPPPPGSPPHGRGRPGPGR